MSDHRLTKPQTIVTRKLAFILALAWLAFLPYAWGQNVVTNQFPILTPESSIRGPGERGVREHTHLRVLLFDKNASAAASNSINDPASIRSAYSLPSTGGSNAIAIVDAFDYPTALNDFNTFSAEYGLPQETASSATGGSSPWGTSGFGPRGPNGFGPPPPGRFFDPDAYSEALREYGMINSIGSSSNTTNTVFQVVYATGQKPSSRGSDAASWNLEAALDIEWAHALAPSAKIYLVEAASDSTSDLMYAVKVASQISGVKEVSMSWGSSEIRSETNYDSYFNTSGVVYVASSGDTSAEPEYPSVCPYVVAAGGTTLNRSSDGAFVSETAWSDTGCGPSAYESRPAFQDAVAGSVGSKRGTADLAFDANPNTGVNVYDSTPYEGEYGWWVLGGTSVAAPSLAGIINMAATSNGFAANGTAELTRIYNGLENAAAFRDITSGKDGGYQCTTGWDFITGVGSPLGLVDK